MPLGISGSTVGIKFFDKAWRKHIEDTHKKLKKRKDTNAKCTAFIGKWIQDNFRSEGVKAIGGSGWVPLSDLTIALRRNKGSESTRILQDIGDLRNKWKRFYTDQDAYIESGVDYGWKHQLGDPKNTWNGKKAPIPARPILPKKGQIRPGIKKIYQIFLKETLK